MVEQFVDRQPTYPNRYKITKGNGTSEYVIIERADVPTVEGTPLNAETFNGMMGGFSDTLAGFSDRLDGFSDALNGFSETGHEHAADDITSGTFAAARIPTISMSKGGTGATNGSTGLKNLLAAGGMVLSAHQYGDTLPAAGTKGRIFFKKVVE